jgi:hypothetical protein
MALSKVLMFSPSTKISGSKGFTFRVIRPSRRLGEPGIEQAAQVKNLAGDAARLYRQVEAMGARSPRSLSAKTAPQTGPFIR